MPEGPEPIPFVTLLPRVGAAVGRYRRRLAARHGLTPTAIGVLAALDPAVPDPTALDPAAPDPADAPSHRELAARLGLSPTTLTPVLDRLEAEGRIGRVRDPTDRRVVRVHRTPLGRACLAAAGPVDLPGPDPAHEPAVRAYLLAVLAALDAAE